MTSRIPTKDRSPDRRTMEDAYALPVGSDYQFSVPNRLYLAVKTATARSWYVRYNIAGLGKAGEGKVSLGNINEVPLDKAMERARLVQADASNGIDPKGEKGCEGGISRGNPTFGAFAEAHLKKKLPKLKNKKHKEKYESSVRRYGAPIWDWPINTVRHHKIAEILDEVWQRAPVMASEVRGRFEAIFAAAKFADKYHGDNPAAWKGNLEHAEGFKAPPKSGMTRGPQKAIFHADMPDFMARLRAMKDSASARCLEVVIHVPLRTSEVIQMRKHELDLDAGRWSIPIERFKVLEFLKKIGLTHFVVPLVPRVVEILRQQIEEVEAAFGKCDYVWPAEARNTENPYLSDGALLTFLTRDMGMKGKATVHGFRATFDTWTRNQKHENGISPLFDESARKLCLTHKPGTDVDIAYMRDALFDMRKPIMWAWADYIAPPPVEAANVTPLKTKQR
jgi:integrase